MLTRELNLVVSLSGDASGEEDALGSGSDGEDGDEEMTEVNPCLYKRMRTDNRATTC